MRRVTTLALAVVVLVPAAGTGPRTPETAAAAGGRLELRGAALVEALRRGGYVLYFRHAATDFSQTDTDTRNLANCRTQRNLTKVGRQDARAIGRGIRRLRIPIGAVFASKYCRTRQTALLAFGRVRTTLDLTSLPSAGSEAEERRRVRALRRALATRPRRGTNTVLAAHLFNIQAAANVSLEEGEAAVFEPRRRSKFRLVARVLPREWSRLAARMRQPAAKSPGFRIREYPVRPGSHPHDVAPARGGGVWYTAQATGHLGWLDPRTGKTRHVPLGTGSAPHGVIVGPDGAPWITDGGLNAIVRVDPNTSRVRRFALPASTGYANLNTAVFDKSGVLWFTGQSGIYGRLEPRTGRIRVFRAPRGPGPYGITVTPDGTVYYASLAGSYLGRIAPRTGRATVLTPPTRGQGARRAWSDSRGRVWISEWHAGRVARYDPRLRRWREWRLPGANSMPYAVYVDERDYVWVSDFGSNALVRLDPRTGGFTVLRLPTSAAMVRQLHGRRREVWGAESSADKLVVVRTR